MSDKICMTAEEILNADVGDIVTYGTYGITYRNYMWHDDHTVSVTSSERSIEETPIEWIVLGKNASNVSVLSKYVLDNIHYNGMLEPITWENSTIREWLNNDFYNTAFTDTEKAHIQTITSVNADNPSYGIGGQKCQPNGWFYPAGGSDVLDKVCLLSLAEIKWYFGEKQDCNEKIGGFLTAEHPILGRTFDWWLRSPGSDSYSAACVCYNGDVNVRGCEVGIFLGVRPAIRISLCEQ